MGNRVIGIWRRRVAVDSDAFIYGIGDFMRTYDSLEDAKAAMDALVVETNKYPSRDPWRAYERLMVAKHPLFVKVSK